jgi:thiopeptide-type bacteriocin biosynthesis protein
MRSPQPLKREKAVRFTDVGTFVFRAPLLPVEAFKQAGRAAASGLACSDGNAGQWRAPIDRPEFRAAVELQSPSLSAALDRSSAASTDDASLALPLYRYTSRAALRCAPRGLFAAAGLGRIAERTDLQLDTACSTRVHVELSLDYLSALARHCLSDDSGPCGVDLSANATLLQSGNTISLWDVTGVGQERTAQQVALQSSGLLRRIVARLGTKRMSESRLRALLHAVGVPDDHLDARVAELLTHRILVRTLGVSTVSADPVGDFIDQLPRKGPLARTRRTLAIVHSRRGFDWGSPRAFSPHALERLRGGLPSLPGFEDVNRMFHIETTLTHSPTLGKAIVADLHKAVERLHFAFGDLHANRLVPFVDAFAERFGEATVPLLRVLDLEHGLGDVGSREPPPSRWARRGRRPAMLRLVHEALARRQRIVSLDPSFWTSIDDDHLPPMPAAFAVLCQIVAESNAAADNGAHEIVFDCAVGTVGTELWARHARASEPMRAASDELRHRLWQEDSGAVRAEVDFTPHRGADIMCRPAVEALRIQCSFGARASDRSALPLSELFVQVRNGRVRLVSKRLKREVLPVIGSAVDPRTVPSPVFRFLASIASQGWATPLTWDWGELLDSPFLPRVCLGKVVLSPAQWRVDRVELQSLQRPRLGPTLGRWTEWRAQRDIPLWVSLRHEEDRLGCDLSQAIGLEMLWKEVSRNGFTVLEELRVEPHELIVSDGAQRYAHELIVPFVRGTRDSGQGGCRRVRARGVRQPAMWAAKFGEGVRLPGSEWVYAKLYASPRRIQAMLRNEVPALVSRLHRDCDIKDWFFFRYRDSDWHLRLRVHAPNSLQRDRVRRFIDATSRSLLRHETVWRVQYDTYFRELERFGGSRACDCVEQLFSAESELALCALHMWQDDQTFGTQCLQLATAWTCWAWTRLGFSRAEMVTLSGTLHNALHIEGHVAHERRRSRGMDRCDSIPVNEGAWRRHALRAGKALDRLRALASARKLSVNLGELAGDLSHLLVNRLFPSRHAEYELQLYQALERQLRHADRTEQIKDRREVPPVAVKVHEVDAYRLPSE